MVRAAFQAFFCQVGGSLRPLIIWLVFVADIMRALIVTEL